MSEPEPGARTDLFHNLWVDYRNNQISGFPFTPNKLQIVLVKDHEIVLYGMHNAEERKVEYKGTINRQTGYVYIRAMYSPSPVPSSVRIELVCKPTVVLF
ncbi:MAG: hypothetical protein KGZ73_09195 [Rhizobiales bacterium]|nr:hypothetical protein [Hyphomicrobiales bacterium]